MVPDGPWGPLIKNPTAPSYSTPSIYPGKPDYIIIILGLFSYVYAREPDYMKFTFRACHFLYFFEMMENGFQTASDGPWRCLIKEPTLPS